MTINATIDIDNARSAILDIERDLNERFAKRERETRALLLALLSRQHIVFIGPPGIAKTAIVGAFARRVDGARVFDIAMMRSTTDVDLLGPIDIVAKRERGEHKRETGGRIGDADIAILDEVYKASAATRNAILRAMDETRVVADGPSSIDCSALRSVIGASNEYPTDDESAAFSARFAFKMFVRPLDDDDDIERVLFSPVASENDATRIDIEALDALTEAARAIPMSEAAKRAALRIRREVADAEVGAANDMRRWMWSVGDVSRNGERVASIARAAALLDGASQVGPEHLAFLADVAFDRERERETVRTIVERIALPMVDAIASDADALVDHIVLLAQDGAAPSRDDVIAAARRATDLRDAIADARKSANADADARLRAIGDTVAEALRTLAARFGGALRS